MSSTKTIDTQKKERQWEVFKQNATGRGVYLVFERIYIFPGEPIPDKYGIELVPHYRLLTRAERRQNKRGTLR